VKSGEGVDRFGRIWIFRGRGRAGEVTAGSHTNSTVHVYAMSGVSVQAKVHFLFSFGGKARRLPRIRQRKPRGTVPPVIASAATQSTFPPDVPSKRSRHGFLRLAASGNEAR
jgi:hypothetical protein